VTACRDQSSPPTARCSLQEIGWHYKFGSFFQGQDGKYRPLLKPSRAYCRALQGNSWLELLANLSIVRCMQSTVW